MRDRRLVAVLTVWLAMTALIAVAAIHKHVPIGWLTREMATTAGVSPFMGVISNIGAFLWSVTAAICLFAGMLLRQRKDPVSVLLLWAGAFSLVLLFDDFFMFHERIARVHLGVGEEQVYAGYGILAMALLVCCRRQILQSAYRMLLVAFAGFALSLAFDLVEPIHGDWNLLPEDGLKLLGILAWSAYYVGLAYDQMAGSPSGKR